MTEKPEHLKQIKIKGFKSIESLELTMNPVNILIGANGAGKSNFISVFSFLNALSKGKLRPYVEQNGYANSFFHFGTKKTQRIVLDVEVNDNSYHGEFIHGVNDDSLIIENEFCRYYESSRFSIKGQNGESGLAGGEALNPSVRNYTVKYLNACRIYHFHDTSPSAQFKKASTLSSSSYLYPDAGNLAACLFFLKRSFRAEYDDIVSCIQTVAPFFHDFYLEPMGTDNDPSVLLRWTHRNYDHPFSANQLSDGTARFICMATLFLQPKALRPDTIILDEPELGLHPAALAVLAEVIKSTAKETQVICSTQSVTLANFFEPEDFIVVDQKNGASIFKRPDANELKEWLEDYDMGDIWSKNLIGGRPEW